MRQYDVVFLDAQGTLINAHPSVAAVYGDVCRRLGKHVDHDLIASSIRSLWAENRRPPVVSGSLYDTSDEITKAWWNSFNARLFQRLGLEDGLETFQAEMWEIFGRPEIYRPYPEVPMVLDELKRRRYRLGVVSNWDSRLPAIFESLGIASNFDFILASAAVGVEKPDPRIFEVALARAGVPPRKAVHVGDDFEADILGARSAGIDAFHLVREEPASSNNHQIRSLQELLAILP